MGQDIAIISDLFDVFVLLPRLAETDFHAAIPAESLNFFKERFQIVDAGIEQEEGLPLSLRQIRRSAHDK